MKRRIACLIMLTIKAFIVTFISFQGVIIIYISLEYQLQIEIEIHKIGESRNGM